jgi:four helix bundle protein
MADFKTLLVWKKARVLVRESYGIAKTFPIEERFALATQMRTASMSISLNIAEGSGRFGAKDQLRMLQIAMGSACELEAQFIHAFDVGYLNKQDAKQAVESVQEVQALLVGFMRHKRSKLKPEQKNRTGAKRPSIPPFPLCRPPRPVRPD